MAQGDGSCGDQVRSKRPCLGGSSALAPKPCEGDAAAACSPPCAPARATPAEGAETLSTGPVLVEGPASCEAGDGIPPLIESVAVTTAPPSWTGAPVGLREPKQPQHDLPRTAARRSWKPAVLKQELKTESEDPDSESPQGRDEAVAPARLAKTERGKSSGAGTWAPVAMVKKRQSSICGIGASHPSQPSMLLGPPCFAATGLELSKRQRRLLTTYLGASIADTWSPEITHLIADTFRRTTKMMCAICSGAHIVVPAYLSACREAGRLVDEGPHVLQDRVCEDAFARKRGITGGYSLAAALERVRRHGPLLTGVSVYCFPSVTERRELPALVQAAGGTWLKRFPCDPEDRESVLLLGERGASSSREAGRRRSFEVYDVEMLREAACTQELRRPVYRLR